MIPLSTQEHHPNKASVRTFVQTLIAALVLVVPVVPALVNIVLDEFGKAGVEPPGWLYLGLTGASVACALVAAIIARIMAIPGVNDVLKRIGFGAEPKPKPVGGEIPRPDVTPDVTPDDEPRH